MENGNIKISSAEKLAITSRTPDKMPLNPTAQGWTGSKIREELGKAILLLVDLLEGKLEDVYETFNAIVNVTVVDDLDDSTRETGVYIKDNDIVFHSGDSEEPVQIGIIDGIFVYRVYQDAEWKVSEGIYEAANPNIQGHIATITGNPHQVTKTDVGLGSVENYGVASEAEAKAGASNVKYMTPLRNKQVLEDYITKTDYNEDKKRIYKASGSLTASGIVSGLLVVGNLGNVYNITEPFTSTSDFLDGGGYTYPAHSNLVVVQAGEGIYKFDVFVGTDVDAVNVKYGEESNAKDTFDEIIEEIDELKERPIFAEEGTYPNLTAGLAYDVEGRTPYLKNSAFDLRVTAEEDTEVRNGLAKIKTLEAKVFTDVDNVITDITEKPTTLVSTNDNLLDLIPNYTNTSNGITVAVIGKGSVKISGIASDDVSLEYHALGRYIGLANNYSAEAYLYAEIIAGSVPLGASVEYNSVVDDIGDGRVGVDNRVLVDGSASYLNQLELRLDIPNTTEIDITIRFYTKHLVNPNQLWVIPNPQETPLLLTELTVDDWFKENVVDYEKRNFTKYWFKNTFNGSEAWELSTYANGVYKHFLPIEDELVEALSTSLKAQGSYSAVGETNIVDGGMVWAIGSVDAINGIFVGTTEDLATFKATIGSAPLTVWLKYATPTITELTTIQEELTYPCYNYGLEFGLLGNKLGVEYYSDFQKQITTNLDSILKLDAEKAETFETSVTILTTDWEADGVTATMKAIKTGISYILASDNPIIAFDLTSVSDTDWNAHRTEFAKIGLASTTNDNEITFYASATPTEDITVIVKVVR